MVDETSWTGGALDDSVITSGTVVVLATSGATSGADVALDVSGATVVDASSGAEGLLDSVDWTIGADVGVVWMSSTIVVLDPVTLDSDETVVSWPDADVDSTADVLDSTLGIGGVNPAAVLLLSAEGTVVTEASELVPAVTGAVPFPAVAPSFNHDVVAKHGGVGLTQAG